MVTRIVSKGAQTQAAPGVNSPLQGPSKERMSKVDTAWLRMDGEHNLMMIVGVWQLKPAIQLAAVQERIRGTLLQYPRFRQRVEHDATGAVWVEDDHFDIHHHICKETLPVVKGKSEEQVLKDRIGVLSMEPLDPKRPLWQMHLIEDYNGGSALIVRIHHCIADGISLIAVTMSIVDGAPPPKVHRPPKNQGPGLDHWLADAVLKNFTKLSVLALGQGGKQAHNAYAAMADPLASLGKGADGAADAAKMAYQVINDMAALALMPDDSPTPLKGLPGNQKRVAWCDPMPIDAVKAVGKAFNCSINDVLMSCVAGAIGSYLQSLGETIEGKDFRAMVPVNLRPLDQAYKLGNHFGLAPMVLPIGVQNPIERLLLVRQRMNRLKNSTQPLLAFGVLAVAGVLIKSAQDAVLDLFGKKASAVLTNVPGPKDKFSFCGATVEQQMFWVPQSGKMGVGISILSYGGGVQFGIITDTQLCPDPHQIIQRFEPEFRALEWHALMLPWGLT
jgi:diacylglycerol O-acyltransferase